MSEDSSPQPQPPFQADDAETLTNALESAQRILKYGDVAREAYHASEFEDTVHEIKAIESQRDDAEYRAVHDSLTGLFNKIGFEKKMNELKEQYPNAIIGVIFMDVDKFKSINDVYGHPFGDQFLRDFSNFLNRNVRHDNDRPGDFLAHDPTLAREGGDEFIGGLILGNKDEPSEEEALLAAEEGLDIVSKRVLDTFKNDFLVKHPKIRSVGAGISIGTAIWEPGMNLEQTKEIADKKMYMVKESKKRPA